MTDEEAIWRLREAVEGKYEMGDYTRGMARAALNHLIRRLKIEEVKPKAVPEPDMPKRRTRG